MSKDDFVTGQTLLNPYVEIGLYNDDNANNYVHVNTQTLERCLPRLWVASLNGQPKKHGIDSSLFAVYGVVGRTVASPATDFAYLNVDESPISRTLMGYLSEEVLQARLPEVHKHLKEGRLAKVVQPSSIGRTEDWELRGGVNRDCAD